MPQMRGKLVPTNATESRRVCGKDTSAPHFEKKRAGRPENSRREVLEELERRGRNASREARRK